MNNLESNNFLSTSYRDVIITKLLLFVSGKQIMWSPCRVVINGEQYKWVNLKSVFYKSKQLNSKRISTVFVIISSVVSYTLFEIDTHIFNRGVQWY